MNAQPQNAPTHSIDFADWQRRISALAYADEAETVQKLLHAAEAYAPLQGQIDEQATALVEHLRKKGVGHGVEAFLQQYGLNTREGVALMCLAEALLRIPDSETADRLIRDKFEGAEFEKHLGHSESMFVNASSWGLMLTGGVLSLSDAREAGPVATFRRLTGRLGEPVVREGLRRAMEFMGTQFVMGESIEEATKKAKPLEKKGYRISYDMLGEGARTAEQAEAYAKSYSHAIEQLGKASKGIDLRDGPSISIKLSALHPRYHGTQEDRVMEELLPVLRGLAIRAREVGVAIAIDAEEAHRLDSQMRVFKALVETPELAGFDGLGFVLQAYQKRALPLVEWLAELARATGHRFPLRLVKGAYWDSEIKHAQVFGLPGFPVFTRKEHTDVSYLACARAIMSHRDAFFPQFATHNAHTLAAIRAMALNLGLTTEQYEFQRLHGMGEKLYDQVIAETPCRIYAPVGAHKDLLAYLIRRLLENGANSSFVNQLMDKSVPVAKVLEDPIAKSLETGGHPDPWVRHPSNLYTNRANSRGWELGNLVHREEIEGMVAQWEGRTWEAAPTFSDVIPAAAGTPGSGKNASDTGASLPDPGARKGSTGVTREVRSPADGRVVGTVLETTVEDADAALARADAAFMEWNRQNVERRAALLEAAADAFDRHTPELLALTSFEAGKTLGDCIAEVREAIDFLRYYAKQARLVLGTPEIMPGPTGEDNKLHLTGRGVFVCISPWNFPLAIFTGQVAAALAAGNTVVAKPAEQTPLIASRAVALLHEVGIPQGVLQLLPGTGETVGAALVKHAKTAGVCFTGSVPVAKIIARELAVKDGPIVPLIAETGGLNALVVDASALLEQATDDIVVSAFGSAGQRCSAARLLCVQEDIAEEFLHMLQGAMQELRPGLPWRASTDLGPVIDEEAASGLNAHSETMQRQAKTIGQTPIPTELAAGGHYVTPRAFRLTSLDQLEREQFGPILHVLTYKAGQEQKLADSINAKGYGLTFGVHSRIEDNIDFWLAAIRTGNIYVNRSIIGATVGVQPFGGMGLSGTGPKAGGPHYLPRFCTEQTVTVNTAAIGGNLELLAKNPQA